MLLAKLAQVSAEVASSRERRAKTALLARCLTEALADERVLSALYLSGQIRQAKLGVAYAQLHGLREVPAAALPSLTIAQLDGALETISVTRGAGSVARRVQVLSELYGRATSEEQSFLTRLLLGELRQGALEPVLLEAVAQAAQVSSGDVRRARMLAGDLAQVIEAAFTEGATGLARFDIVPLRPVLPMLAEPAADIDEALEILGRAWLDVKLDGARIQVHKLGHEVRVYARSMNDVTASVPEIVEFARALSTDSVILDGEAIAMDTHGRPLPFQETMRRFGRKLEVEALRSSLPVSAFFFDCLFAHGESLLDKTTEQRLHVRDSLLPESARVAALITSDAKEARAFLERARANGHEGIMAKSLSAPYFAGSRGKSWLKIKPAHTLDLVVLAAEWGSGRRKGTLSNLHLGAYDPDSASFVMLGKTFKGLTDELLRFQTKALLAIETHRDAMTVYVRPELVVEIAFNDVQASPRYPGGLTLRFARVKRYRADKRPLEADTIATVRAIHRAQTQPTQSEPS
jgi:DNA ligase-1